MKPIRIQRKRTKGWRMPPNTVYVGRGSEWGNPYIVGVHGDARECIAQYARDLFPYRHTGPTSTLMDLYISEAHLHRLEKLRGKNLACWCPLDQPCHADLLLEEANAPG